MTDRRRLNGPPGGTAPPILLPLLTAQAQRNRHPDQLRNIFLQTGTIPTASGSAYYELEVPQQTSFVPASTIKLSCAVHGPKPLPRNANFSPNLQLTAAVKYAPFATRIRRGYIRDSTERDLGVHLENALKGLIIPDRWPKSSIDVSVLVLEGEDNGDLVPNRPLGSVAGQVGLMNILAGCITVATAALLDAKIDSLDVMAGGVAATIGEDGNEEKILDPTAAEHANLRSACVVGYLPGRDELTEVWTSGPITEQSRDGSIPYGELLDSAVSAARAASIVLKEAILDASKRPRQSSSGNGKAAPAISNQAMPILGAAAPSSIQSILPAKSEPFIHVTFILTLAPPLQNAGSFDNMSKAAVSEGAVFLLQCIKHSDCKINWQTVGDALGINSSAASMRMTRLKDRIKKQGGTAASKGWTGELDQDAHFLFQCIITCTCKIDYKKVASALGINASAASMRFTRLKAKYANLGTDDALAAARPVPNDIQGGQQLAERKTNKRKYNTSNAASEGDLVPNIKKVKKKVAKEENDDVEDAMKENPKIETSDKRQTRGKVLDFKKIFDNSDSDDEPAHIGTVDGSSDLYYEDEDSEASAQDASDEDWSAEDDTDTDSNTPIKERGGLVTPVTGTQATFQKVQTPRSITPSSAKFTETQIRRNTSPNTPVSLSGIKILQSHRAASHAAEKLLPSPIKASSPASGSGSSSELHDRSGRDITPLKRVYASRMVSDTASEISVAKGLNTPSSLGSSLLSKTASEHSVYISASASRDSSFMDSDAGLELQVGSKLAEHVEERKDTMGEACASIEFDVEAQSQGFFKRFVSWWK